MHNDSIEISLVEKWKIASILKERFIRVIANDEEIKDFVNQSHFIQNEKSRYQLPVMARRD
jgi:hypothetical protein